MFYICKTDFNGVFNYFECSRPSIHPYTASGVELLSSNLRIPKVLRSPAAISNPLLRGPLRAPIIFRLLLHNFKVSHPLFVTVYYVPITVFFDPFVIIAGNVPLNSFVRDAVSYIIVNFLSVYSSRANISGYYRIYYHRRRRRLPQCVPKGSWSSSLPGPPSLPISIIGIGLIIAVYYKACNRFTFSLLCIYV